MTRPRYQEGSLVVCGKRRRVWVIRWRENVLQPDGSVKRLQRAETLGPVRNITRQLARSILNQKFRTENLNQRRPQAIRPFAEFVSEEWSPNAKLAVKKSTMRYYNFQLERHILPEFGSCSLSDVNRAQVESLLSKLRQKGHANGTLRGVRTTISTVLQSAVDRGYIENNSAHGIRIRATGPKPDARFYTPVQVRKLLPELSEPCRTVVLVAVLTRNENRRNSGSPMETHRSRTRHARSGRNVFGRRIRHFENAQQSQSAPHQFESSRSVGTTSLSANEQFA